jgi:hypothetical protein
MSEIDRGELILAAVTGLCANPEDLSVAVIARCAIHVADTVRAELSEEDGWFCKGGTVAEELGTGED